MSSRPSELDVILYTTKVLTCATGPLIGYRSQFNMVLRFAPGNSATNLMRSKRRWDCLQKRGVDKYTVLTHRTFGRCATNEATRHRPFMRILPSGLHRPSGFTDHGTEESRSDMFPVSVDPTATQTPSRNADTVDTRPKRGLLG